MPARPLRPPQLLLAALLLAGAALVQAQPIVTGSPVRGPANAHEQLLEQIRGALGQAMLDQPTQVHSAAWIDDQGRLHETAHFQAHAEVRGIRVQSYLGQEQTARHEVRFDLVPPALLQTRQADACPAGRDVKLPMQWRVRIEGVSAGDQLFAHQTLARLVRQSWERQVAGLRHWADLGQRPERAHSAYLQTLTGSPGSHASWGAEIVVSPASPEVSRWDKVWAGQQRLAWRIALHWGPQQAEQPMRVHWQDSVVLEAPASELSDGPGAWAQAMQLRIEQQIARWSRALDERGRCTPQQFQVEANAHRQQSLTLQGGVSSGLRSGDRFLLFDRAQLPGRSLEAGALQRMALAEVVRTSQHTSELRLLAGPPPASTGPWVAVPL